MRQPSDEEVKTRFQFDNPWWTAPDSGVLREMRDWPKRAYFEPFLKQVKQTSVKRAVVLMGPRRVGKTVMLRQAIQALIDDGVDPKTIFYASLETPIYIGYGLERLFRLFCAMHGHDLHARLYVFFDEIQYLKGWEVHLKSFVDSFLDAKAIVSGSAAAALRYASNESGAGRFSDFVLPPLSFAEFVDFSSKGTDQVRLVEQLNKKLIEYLNYGGFPEAVINADLRRNFQKFIGEDVLSKVMLRDLPSLYGIDNPQELNQFFTLVALNSGAELNIETLSKHSGVALNTVKKYLQYLEAAFLIRRVNRIDRNARKFKRATTFKVYLTNPCLRAALFGPVDSDPDDLGLLVETMIFSNYFQSGDVDSIYYARWDNAEIDFIGTALGSIPTFAVECKWSDSFYEDERSLSPYVGFAKRHGLKEILCTSKSVSKSVEIDGIQVLVVPTCLYGLSYGLVNSRQIKSGAFLAALADGTPFLRRPSD